MWLKKHGWLKGKTVIVSQFTLFFGPFPYIQKRLQYMPTPQSFDQGNGKIAPQKLCSSLKSVEIIDVLVFIW